MKMAITLVAILIAIAGCAAKVKVLDSMIPDLDMEEEE